MNNEIIRKRPIGLTVFGIFFAIMVFIAFFGHLKGLQDLTTKDQIVKVFEDSIAQAEKTQDFKPSQLQKEYVKALKEYRVSAVDYAFKFISLTLTIALLIIAIAIFTNKKWTVIAINWFIAITIVEELIERAVLLFIKPLPTPASINLTYNQKAFLYVQGFIPVLGILLLMLWYFNRKPIKAYFESGSTN